MKQNKDKKGKSYYEISKCKNCGKEFKKYIKERHGTNNQIGIRRANATTCSVRCSKEWRTKGFKHNHWKQFEDGVLKWIRDFFPFGKKRGRPKKIVTTNKRQHKI
jgi:hypothetical protein